MRLSTNQRAWLEEIAAQIDRGEPFASNAGGYLSIRTGNYGATHQSLVRRGLVTAEYDDYSDPLDAPWMYQLTDAGRAALSSTQPRAPQGGKG